MSNTSILGGIAMAVSIVALIMSMVALNRTSEENLQLMVEEQVEQTLQQLFVAPQPDADGDFENESDDGEL